MIDPQALGLETFKVRGDEVQVLCPFHDDHAPSASFNVVKGVMYCYACGSHMYARQIAEELGGQVCELADVGLINRVKDEREWRHFLHAPLAYDHPYLIKRKVTNGQVERYDIKDLGSVIGIPLHSAQTRGGDSQICGILTRRTDRRSGVPRYILYGEKPPLWPFNAEFRSIRRPLLVEGIFAALRAERAGITAFAILGTAIPRRSLRFFNGRQPTTFFDLDFAGCIAAVKFVLATRATALLDETPADEVPSKKAFQHVISNGERTDDPIRLASASGDARKFWKHLDKWQQKVMFSKHSFQSSGITR